MIRTARSKINNVLFRNPLFKKENLPRLLLAVVILFLLFYVYNHFLKEGFECSPKEVEQHCSKEDKLLVLFYADWCGHCKTVKPVWKEASKKANEDGTKMIMVNVGNKTHEEQALIDKYEIDGFPTILLFQNGSHEQYTGKRDLDSFLNALH